MSEIIKPEGASKLYGWYLAARPATLPAAIVPVVVGAAVAISDRHFHPLVLLATLLASVLIQIGTNLANDYFDFRKGADTADRLGPTRVTQSGVFTPSEVATATAIVFGAALLFGLYLVSVGGVPILLIGLLSILAGIAYTGGPYPLGYHGWGDLFVFIFFGVLGVAGTYYLQTGSLTLTALMTSIPVGALCTNILVVNNLRDIDTDRATGKGTLAVRIGRKATGQEYLLLMLIAYTVPLTLWLAGVTWGFSFWLPYLTVPRAARLVWFVQRERGRALNQALKGTADLHLRYGLLFALSLLH
jgi:1,4-dihydroxy-2-naphthoate octaprenyltransferase